MLFLAATPPGTPARARPLAGTYPQMLQKVAQRLGRRNKTAVKKERTGNKGPCGDRFLLKSLGDMPEKITTP
jgi:hypothetical protein